ncbi:MAG: TIGR02281 family clan AA aspartic protease [Gammaproteobacteria bacterium]|jgi:aspartyl protease family protein|nr:TIGR02281 family clan AA aspartic protease [Gammaproteobacteria bacterium]HCC44612.1 TIGR02281 family clan AA aspartic protease [Gammaproteobacteria bacterium]|tara:strand:+ start:411 stop:920 length:510 start_codon:yes stop_codon:yes gene_type:complete
MNPNRTGQGMLFVSLVIGMAMLTWFFAGVEERQYNPNADPSSFAYADTIEVPLERNRFGHYLVNGQINGNTVAFLLDTGATDVVVPENIAKRLELPYGRRSQAMTANGRVNIYRTRVKELRIGKITLNDIDASINPAMKDGAILLGMSALSRIEFTQAGNTLTLRQKSG